MAPGRWWRVRRLSDWRAALPLLGVLLCGLLLGAPSAPAGEPAPDAAQALARLLDSFASLKADFTQTAPGLEQGEQAGRLWLQKPGKFRIESGPPLSQTVVSDGAHLWQHDLDLEQALVAPLPTDPAEAPALLLAGKAAALTARFAVEAHGELPLQTYLLRAKGGEAVQELTLVFAGGRPKAIVLEAGMHGRSLIEFSAVQLDLPLPESLFDFTLPEGVDLIDSR